MQTPRILGSGAPNRQAPHLEHDKDLPQSECAVCTHTHKTDRFVSLRRNAINNTAYLDVLKHCVFPQFKDVVTSCSCNMAHTCPFRQHYETGEYLCISVTIRDWRILEHFGNIARLAHTCAFRQHYTSGAYLCISATLRDWRILAYFGNITRLEHTCAFRQHYATGEYLRISATLHDWRILVYFGNIMRLAHTCVFLQHYATRAYLCISATLHDWRILVHFGNIMQQSLEDPVSKRWTCREGPVSSPPRSLGRNPFSLHHGVCEGRSFFSKVMSA
jgi:hypothetical protein